MKSNTPNLDNLALLGMVKVGQRWISVAPIGMIEVYGFGEDDFKLAITWTTGEKIYLSSEEWADFEKWLKDLHYQMAKQASAQQPGGLIRTH